MPPPTSPDVGCFADGLARPPGRQGLCRVQQALRARRTRAAHRSRLPSAACWPRPLQGSDRWPPGHRWAHARRKLYDVHATTNSPLARKALERIGQLFAIEAGINGHPPAYRLAARQARSLPKLDALRAFLEQSLATISKKSSLASAIRYSLARWPALCRFTTDGRLEMTNNAAERAIRPLALGRKNWLFAGSDNGGRRAATIYTITQTAILNGHDPEAYLRDILARIADHPINRIDELLPWRWRPTGEAQASSQKAA